MYKKYLVILAISCLVTPLAMAKSKSNEHKHKYKHLHTHHFGFRPHWSLGAAFAYAGSGPSIGLNTKTTELIDETSGSAYGAQIFAEYSFMPHFSITPYIMKLADGSIRSYSTNSSSYTDTLSTKTTTVGVFLNANINIHHGFFASVGLGPQINFNCVKAADLNNFSMQSGTSASAIATPLAGKFELGYHATHAITASIAYMMLGFLSGSDPASIGKDKNPARALEQPNIWLFGLSYTFH